MRRGWGVLAALLESSGVVALSWRGRGWAMTEHIIQRFSGTYRGVVLPSQGSDDLG